MVKTDTKTGLPKDMIMVILIPFIVLLVGILVGVFLPKLSKVSLPKSDEGNTLEVTNENTGITNMP